MSFTPVCYHFSFLTKETILNDCCVCFVIFRYHDSRTVRHELGLSCRWLSAWSLWSIIKLIYHYLPFVYCQIGNSIRLRICTCSTTSFHHFFKKKNSNTFNYKWMNRKKFNNNFSAWKRHTMRCRISHSLK